MRRGAGRWASGFAYGRISGSGRGAHDSAGRKAGLGEALRRRTDLQGVRKIHLSHRQHRAEARDSRYIHLRAPGRASEALHGASDVDLCPHGPEPHAVGAGRTGWRADREDAGAGCGPHLVGMERPDTAGQHPGGLLCAGHGRSQFVTKPGDGVHGGGHDVGVGILRARHS